MCGESNEFSAAPVSSPSPEDSVAVKMSWEQMRSEERWKNRNVIEMIQTERRHFRENKKRRNRKKRVR